LRPSHAEAGIDALWGPVLAPRTGYCDYSCTACGDVCPTGAILKLALEDKRRWVLGLAQIDEERCIPWADNVDCIVCEEMCPIPEKAVRLETVQMESETGETVELRRPSVVADLCNGCGICEHQCPVNGESAIRVLRR
jgi:ferredoxin